MKILKCFLVSVMVFVSSFAFVACGKSNYADKPLSGTYKCDEVLVAYFSCTNNTEQVAEYIENYCESDIFEIEPAQPYTIEDLEYGNSSSRANLEDKDRKARPEIKNSVENIEKYKVIFLGYPIWFGKAPKIIYTFLESYDFDDVVIIPFCTSASSSIGNSAKNLHSLAPHAMWKTGMRFQSYESQEIVESWLEEINIQTTF